MTDGKLADELDEPFVRTQRVVQRAGWGVMLAIVLLALLGAFGTSPFSSGVETREAGGARYEVEHPRVTRYQLVERLHVRVDAPAAGGDELQIAFSTPWTENNAILGTTPEADGGGAGAEGATYTYAIEDWSRPVSIAFAYEARKAFWDPGIVTVTAGDLAPVELPLDAWVHP